MAMELLSKLPYDHPYRWDGTEFGSGKLWRPSELGADLGLWLDAEDTDSVVLNGSNVSQWNDKSANARNARQPNAVGQPTYQSAGLNSKPAIAFNGSTNILGFDDQTLGKNVGALSYFIVFIADAPATTDYRALFDLHTGGVNDRASIYPRQNAFEAGGRRLDTDPYQFQQATTLGTSATIGSAIFNYSAATLGVGLNGNALSFRAGGFQTPGNTSNTDSNYIGIGASVDAADRFAVNFGFGCDCTIAEIVCLQSAPNDATRQKIEGYLAWKWNLVANLPAGHPYKLSPPFVLDPEAQKYLRAVEAADGQPLEQGIRLAVNNFVVGCKEDGIWDAVKSSAILAGARTLGGALVPLKGTAPTNFNFVAGDYNRKTGLVGDGSTKYLDSNRNNNADPQNNKHLSAYLTQAQSGTSGIHVGTNTAGTLGTCQIASDLSGNSTNFSVNNIGTTNIAAATPRIGFLGATRSAASELTVRADGANSTALISSNTPNNISTFIFCRNGNAVFSNARIAFYSIGESVDLALLDARVTTLISQVAFAINTGLSASNYSAETIAYVNAGYAAGGTLA